MPRKSKLNSMHQTHGKVENPITLDQVWGDTGTNKYGTVDAAEYEKYLNELNKSDLQAHAVKVGLVPVDDKNMLISRLKREFLKHTSSFTVKKNEKKQIKLSKFSKNTLSEGK